MEMCLNLWSHYRVGKVMFQMKHCTMVTTIGLKTSLMGNASGRRILKPLEEDVIAVEKVAEEGFFEMRGLKDESMNGVRVELEKLKKELSRCDFMHGIVVHRNVAKKIKNVPKWHLRMLSRLLEVLKVDQLHYREN